MAPRISVLIDTYNHERYIEEAVRSVLDQDAPPSQFEIIVVDDGSTDRTPEIVSRFEPRVRLLRKKNGGQASAFNAGIAEARGELVAFLDGDDVWLPDKLSRVAERFNADPRVVMLYHKYCFWDATENRTWLPDYFAEVSGDVVADRHKLATYIAAPTSSLVFRREVLERLTPIPISLTIQADAYLFVGAIFLGPVAAVSECLAKNRIHGANLWYAEHLRPDGETLRRRMLTRQAVIDGVRRWVDLNVPRSMSSQARFILKRWELVQERDMFQMEPPGRFRYFAFLCQNAWIHASTVSRKYLAFKWFQAFAALILGYKRSDLLEDILTKIKKAKIRLQHRRRPEERERLSV